MVFERVIYRPAEGFPVANEKVLSTRDAVSCCVQCQTTVSTPCPLYCRALANSTQSLFVPAPSTQQGSRSATSASRNLTFPTPVRPLYLREIPRASSAHTRLTARSSWPPAPLVLGHVLRIRSQRGHRAAILAVRVACHSISGRSAGRTNFRRSTLWHFPMAHVDGTV
jgi:hypothetical protein